MRCTNCPNTHRQVLPDGPRNARVMLVGEGPGYWEDKEGIPFIGKSGFELDHTYLPLAGLSRDQVFVTNAVQCRCERNGQDVKPSQALIDVCAENHLHAELLDVWPELVILCGASACSLVKNVRLNLEFEHGRVQPASIGPWQGLVCPMYHPAAGLHETRFMIPLLEDWKHLFDERPATIGEEPHYKLLHAEPFLYDFNRPMGVDTESNEGQPYSVQVSQEDGIAFMVLVEDTVGMDHLCVALNNVCEIVMHNAAYDLLELEELGVHPRKYRDTMQELYHLGNLPQGLKAAVYRIFGHRMTSYDEVVTPYSKAFLAGWLAEALDYASTALQTTVAHPPGPDCPACGKKHRKDVSVRKPHECEAVLRRVLNALNDPESEYDAWEMPKYSKGVEKCRLLGREWLGVLEEKLGRMPRKSIVHAPIEQQVAYGCSDSDWTLRLAKWLETERARIVQEEWKV